MNALLAKRFGWVTAAHVAAISALIFGTFLQGCISQRGQKNQMAEFVVDVIPTMQGPEDEKPDAAALEFPDPAPPPPDPPPAPVVDTTSRAEPEKKAEPAKKSEKKPEKKPTPPVEKKTAKKKIVPSTKVVERNAPKGPFPHYNPLSKAEINRLYQLGAKPGSYTTIPGEEDIFKHRVRKALLDNWTRPSKQDAGNASPIVRLWIGDGGVIQRWEFEQRSGIAVLDDSVQQALEGVRVISGLSPGFINAYRSRGLAVDFVVEN
jgi:type IV secretory pathway VirB10-like protein